MSNASPASEKILEAERPSGKLLGLCTQSRCRQEPRCAFDYLFYNTTSTKQTKKNYVHNVHKIVTQPLFFFFLSSFGILVSYPRLISRPRHKLRKLRKERERERAAGQRSCVSHDCLLRSHDEYDERATRLSTRGNGIERCS